MSGEAPRRRLSDDFCLNFLITNRVSLFLALSRCWLRIMMGMLPINIGRHCLLEMLGGRTIGRVFKSRHSCRPAPLRGPFLFIVLVTCVGLSDRGAQPATQARLFRGVAPLFSPLYARF